jgi:hypothetical protein
MNTKALGNGTDPDVAWHDGAACCVWQDGVALHVARLDAVTLEETWRETWLVGAPNVYAKLYAYRGQLWLGWREGTAPYRIVLRVIGTTHQEFLDDRGDGPDAGHGSHPFIFGGGDVVWQASGAPQWDVWRRPLSGGTPRLVRSGVGTGLSRIRGAQVTTVDEDRHAIPGYTRPCWAADDVFVAEGPSGGAYARFRDRELTLWPEQAANTPRCAMDGDRLVVVAWGPPHNVRIGVFAYGEMSPVGEGALVPLDRPAYVGGFYVTTDKYAEAVTDYPQNCEVIVEASAVARATRPVIVSPDALAGVAHAQRVIGLYVAAEEEGTAAALDLAAELARAEWYRRFPSHPVPAVVGYVTRGMAARGTWPPRSVDVFAPECYFDAAPSAAGVEALVAGWAHVLTATRPWLLVIQEYDRNGAQRHLMDALAATLPAYLEAMRPRPWVLGLLAFAVNRPGGVRDYPALLAAHRRIFAAVPSAPTTLPVAVAPIDPPPPDPGESDVTITIPPDGYAKTGRVGEGAHISFSLGSDSPVTSLTVDFLGDGLEGRTIRSGDLRDFTGLDIKPRRAGLLRWQLSATNSKGEQDTTSGDSRPILVQE